MEARRETPLGDTQDPFAAPGARLQRLLRWVRRNSLIPILLLAAAVRFYDLTAEAIWGDEGSSVLLARYPLSEIWRHAAFDVHPPLYFMLLRGWIGLFGDGIFALRCFSALPGIATVGLGMWLVDRLATRRAAVIAGVLLALLPTAVRYSQDVRMYALLGLLLLAANLALVYWVRRPQRHRYLVVYALLMGAALYTHYFAVFAALSHWLYLGLVRLLPGFRLRHVQQPGWWLANLGIAVLFLPWLPSLLGLLQHMDELKVGGDVGWEDPVTLASLPSMIWAWLTQDDGEQWSLPVFVGMPLAMLVLVGVALMRDRTVNHGSVLLALYTLVPLLLVFAVSFITPVFVDRYLMAYALGLPMLAALAIDRLYGNARVLALAVLVSWIGIELTGVNNNATVDRDDQFNVAVEFVNQHFVSGDRIVTSDMLFYLSYVYYNRTDAKIRLYTPPAADGRSTRPNEYGFGTLVSEDVYLDRLADLPDGSDRIWLIGSLNDPDEYPPLTAEWQRTREVHGGDIYARLYVRPSADKPGG
ncbi:glycosyltransferase family 39 protein [Pseudomonas sp. COR58]|uniref:Glycosyltransferase family 39 protein n=1 Tax=Pseudomonas ekonensis TaxID=2842353 RepID=A0ABS6PKI2_9PSED|nr:glycosyltransferase family 39 protein [Pseudomonas ekonensis]MBV4460983.1 glycosyltransferase family 39 protein [Pseudomonas ekonensis]